MHKIKDVFYDSERLILYKQIPPPYILDKLTEITDRRDNTAEIASWLDNFISTPRTVKNKLFAHVGICLTYNCQLRCNYCNFKSDESEDGQR